MALAILNSESVSGIFKLGHKFLKYNTNAFVYTLSEYFTIQKSLRLCINKKILNDEV